MNNSTIDIFDLFSMNKNFDEQIFMDQIAKLREKVNINEYEIREHKKAQMELFKTRFAMMKQNGEFVLDNEIIYSCLFGNGIN